MTKNHRWRESAVIIFGNAVREILLLGISTPVREREDRNGWLVRQRKLAAKNALWNGHKNTLARLRALMDVTSGHLAASRKQIALSEKLLEEPVPLEPRC